MAFGKIEQRQVHLLVPAEAWTNLPPRHMTPSLYLYFACESIEQTYSDGVMYLCCVDTLPLTFGASSLPHIPLHLKTNFLSMITDLTTCCTSTDGPHCGDWYFANGTRLSFTAPKVDTFEVRETQRVDIRLTVMITHQVVSTAVIFQLVQSMMILTPQ